jgi:hypothetical protein
MFLSYKPKHNSLKNRKGVGAINNKKIKRKKTVS